MSKRYFLPDGRELFRVHDDSLCAGRVCVIHNPTEHHMSSWLLNWREDRGMFERLCPHFVGHPDPDQFEYWAESGRLHAAIHGCDMCCYDHEIEEVLF